MSSSANSVPARDEQGQQKKSYKEQLDEIATKPKTSEGDGDNANQVGLVDTVVEKVSQYVPALGKVLGQDQQEHSDTSPQTESKIPGLPERPHHDTQIEEFVRDQHRSRTEDGNFAS